jgi:hypothetical protein
MKRSKRPKRLKFNPKPALSKTPDLTHLAPLASKVRYGGKPEHKRNPGDFNLNPPAAPSLDKTLCDEAGILKKGTAIELLREGLRRGLVSAQQRQGWPKRVWALHGDIAMEAIEENPGHGVYHGYPVSARQRDLIDAINKRWAKGSKQ